MCGAQKKIYCNDTILVSKAVPEPVGLFTVWKLTMWKRHVLQLLIIIGNFFPNIFVNETSLHSQTFTN